VFFHYLAGGKLFHDEVSMYNSDSIIDNVPGVQIHPFSLSSKWGSALLHCYTETSGPVRHKPVVLIKVIVTARGLWRVVSIPRQEWR